MSLQLVQKYVPTWEERGQRHTHGSVHSHTVHLPPGALLIWCTMCVTMCVPCVSQETEWMDDLYNGRIHPHPNQCKPYETNEVSTSNVVRFEEVALPNRVAQYSAAQ